MPLKKKEQVAVTVSILDKELELSIPHNATGLQLFNTVMSEAVIEEQWFFGLKYDTQDGHSVWLVPHEKVLNQVESQKTPLHFKLGVAYYPENAREELVQDITRQYIFSDVKESIFSEKIMCTKEEAETFAVYFCQAVYGDFREGICNPGELAPRVLPQGILKEVEITNEMWETLIAPEWIKVALGGTYRHREDAMLRYIEHAERLEMYGKIYSPVQNKKGDSLLFCVSHSGVSLCEEDKRKTLEKFDWCDIATLKNDGKQLSIKLQSGQKRVYTTMNPQISRSIQHLCLHNKEQHSRRQQPESEQVVRMKIRAKEDRKSREIFADDEVRRLKEHLQFHEAEARKIRKELSEKALKRDNSRRLSGVKRSERMAETLKQYRSAADGEKQTQSIQEVEGEDPTKAEQVETEAVNTEQDQAKAEQVETETSNAGTQDELESSADVTAKYAEISRLYEEMRSMQLRIQELEAELRQKNVAPPTQEPKNVVPQTQEAKNVVPQAKNGVPQTQEAKKLPEEPDIKPSVEPKPKDEIDFPFDELKTKHEGRKKENWEKATAGDIKSRIQRLNKLGKRK